ncbi:CoA transferase subunit A [Acidilobus saccharovorans]|nr:CoA-transferase [Acidilobus saccharovorans]
MPSVKLTSLSEAAGLVRDNDEVTISGMTFFRNPMALISAIIRAGVKNLSFVDREPGLGLDIMVASGAVNRVRAAMATFEHYGLAPTVRRKAEEGAISYLEDTCGAVIAGLRAGAQGVPFMPTRGVVGSDLLKIHEAAGTWKVIEDPFTGEKLVAVRSIEPDVALIHVHVSDEYGNAMIMGPRFEDELKIRAAKMVILSAEKVVGSEELRKLTRDLGLTLSATSLYVSAVVRAPEGAWPTGVYGLYEPDYGAIEAYYKAAKQGLAANWIRDNLLRRWQ